MNFSNIKNFTLASSTTINPVENGKLNTTEYIALSQLTLVFLFGTIGNLLVIYVFAWKKRSRRKRFESLLLLLAITDFLSSVFVPALFMYGTVTKFKKWHFGYYGCKIFTSFLPATLTISQGILVLISYERYKSITNPLGSRLTKRFIVTWLICTCLIALLVVSPFTYTLELVDDEAYGVNTCVPSGKKFHVIYLYSLVVFSRDFLATLAMIILGVYTSKGLKKGEMLLSGHGIARRLKNFKTARKMLLVVVCVFSVCVLPVDMFQVSLYTLIMAKIRFDRNTYSVILNSNTFLTILQIANSATNILIYSKMHKDFTRNLFACARKGNSMLKDSFRRVTFRSRGDSVMSFTEDFNAMANENGSLMKKKTFKRMTIKRSDTRETCLDYLPDINENTELYKL